MNETVEPAIVQTALAEASMVKVAARPDVAVAVTVYVGPLTVAAPGAVEVKLIVCAPLPTANDCCT